MPPARRTATLPTAIRLRILTAPATLAPTATHPQSPAPRPIHDTGADGLPLLIAAAGPGTGVIRHRHHRRRAGEGIRPIRDHRRGGEGIPAIPDRLLVEGKRPERRLVVIADVTSAARPLVVTKTRLCLTQQSYIVTRVWRVIGKGHYGTSVKDSGTAKHQTQPEYMMGEMSIVYRPRHGYLIERVLYEPYPPLLPP